MPTLIRILLQLLVAVVVGASSAFAITGVVANLLDTVGFYDIGSSDSCREIFCGASFELLIATFVAGALLGCWMIFWIYRYLNRRFAPAGATVSQPLQTPTQSPSSELDSDPSAR